MKNKKLNLNEMFREEKGRIDGAVTLICVMVSLIAPILVAGFKSISFKIYQFNWLSLIVPIIIFLIYVRFRQLDSEDNKFRQIINSTLIGVISFSLAYVINFK